MSHANGSTYNYVDENVQTVALEQAMKGWKASVYCQICRDARQEPRPFVSEHREHARRLFTNVATITTTKVIKSMVETEREGFAQARVSWK